MSNLYVIVHLIANCYGALGPEAKLHSVNAERSEVVHGIAGTDPLCNRDSGRRARWIRMPSFSESVQFLEFAKSVGQISRARASWRCSMRGNANSSLFR